MLKYVNQNGGFIMKRRMKRTTLIISLLLVILVMSGCASTGTPGAISLSDLEGNWRRPNVGIHVYNVRLHQQVWTQHRVNLTFQGDSYEFSIPGIDGFNFSDSGKVIISPEGNSISLVSNVNNEILLTGTLRNRNTLKVETINRQFIFQGRPSGPIPTIRRVR